ncbi:MAG TPA: hypothetical protein VEA80_05250 [Vitreimonas sp.]|uniref:hypothetical protein n=1 Tax=Vitreimonas sp. TaxID=3069702 RepID=UPI002D554B1A|nr:hypothetical protein [Vitreimonas sp.]HYD86859.1 hypothetical protein [Vitreimonas sp.]
MTTRFILAAALLACACAEPAPSSEARAQEQAASIAGSLFASTPDRQWRLPDQLREVSGLAAAPGGRLFAHDDERAVIYEIDASQGRIVKAFALGDPVETGDFEGLAITPAGQFWLVTSQGELLRFNEGSDGEIVRFARFDAGLRGVCEIEGLASLAAEESLILACKRNEARGMRDTISLYAWRDGAGMARPWRRLPEAELIRAAGIEHFRPSSLDIDPRTGRLILLSARDGAVAELDGDRVSSARALAAQHVQAEGAAVLADGSLAVADEGGDGRALLSIYARVAE